MATIASCLYREAAWYGAIAQLGERIVRNDEVGGSIPPGSTSLRSLRELRLGKPAQIYRGEASEGCPAEARRAEADVLNQLELRELRLGKPVQIYRGEASEGVRAELCRRCVA